MNDISNAVVYNDGELELKVSVNEETIWLTQSQMSELFGTSTDNIGLHLKNIYKEIELNENSTTENFSVVRQEGKRKVTRLIKHYNLDAIISVGYRISSSKATKFRQWATTILKSYIQNGYVINSDKITNERFVSLEKDVNILKNKIDVISSRVEDNSLKIKQGIFFDGQVYDAHSFVSNLLRTVKEEIILIDNYIDDTTFTLFLKVPDIKLTIFINTISKQLKLDFEKYSKQYNNITLKTFKKSHDRFLIIDKKEVYHLGASIKDLGKKWFAFSKIDIRANDLLSKLI
ncbi:DNA-binding protein [Malaciobacter molluscorum]|uniref:virulence RhuM family protein n=1 Tax=Malaciobacter molluscorum TaxID=1032072 RepID=UPI00100AA529|nr:RhuM family protein [Malaciobacter molluscorum]RXJ94188.1 DNA-binding protein [Malaciobacter molluscorum]